MTRPLSGLVSLKSRRCQCELQSPLSQCCLTEQTLCSKVDVSAETKIAIVSHSLHLSSFRGSGGFDRGSGGRGMGRWVDGEQGSYI